METPGTGETIHLEGLIESRDQLRLKARGCASAALLGHNVSDPIRVGQITDISMKGLSFNYIPFEDPSSDPLHIQIFAYDGSLTLLDCVPCRIVYDVEASKRAWHRLPTRRCGVQFGELSEAQISELKNFIRAYANEDI